MEKEIFNKKELDIFSLKQAIVLLVNGFTANGEYNIEDTVKEIQEVLYDYTAELKKQKKKLNL